MLIDLIEETQKSFSKKEIDEEVALKLSSYHEKIDLVWPNPTNDFNYKIKSRGWVGYIPIDKKNIISIKPKAPLKNIFGMLEYAYKLKSLNFLEGTIELDNLNDLFEELAAILSKQIIIRIKKGLYGDYVNQTEDSVFVRGRININETIKNFNNGFPKVNCSFQEHLTDLEDNQILLWTIHTLSRTKLEKERVRKLVNQAYRGLVQRVSLNRKSALDCLDRIYHRMNIDYQPMHILCRFFLENIGPSLGGMKNDFIPFILNMPNLFESFVAEWLKQNVPEYISVIDQHKVNLNPDGSLSFRIDIVLRDNLRNKTLCVLDTKYKINENPNESDIAQITAYAAEQKCDHGFLIYPSSHVKETSAFPGNIKINTIVFDISKNIDESGNNFLKSLLNKLN